MRPQSALVVREINTPPSQKRRSHDTHLGPSSDSFAVYLHDLYALLPHRPDLLFLMLALDHFRRDDEPCRDHWDRHVNLRWTPRDGSDPRESDDPYWHRTWAMREKARRIIEGRQAWPEELLGWKTWREMQWGHGFGPQHCKEREPAWLGVAASRDIGSPTIARPSLRRLKLNTRKAHR